MTEQTFSAARSPEGPRLRIQSLWRLATWGTLATVALFVAVISAFSSAGSQHSAAAAAASAAPAQQAVSEQAASLEMQQRSFAAEVRMQLSNNTEETRRLSDAVHVLAADRDQLTTRMTAIEHNLENVTGSLKRDRTVSATPQLAPPQLPQTPTQTQGQVARPEAPVTTGSIAASPAAPVLTASVPASSAAEVTVAAVQPPLAAKPAQSEAIKTPVPDAATGAMASVAGSDPLPASGLGVDVGGAANFDGLRALWHSTKNNDPSLLDDFYPVVATRENSKSHAPELRLIIGPMPDAEAAAQLCVTLAASHQYCQPVAFEGQRLAGAEVGSKAAAAHRRGAPAAPVTGFKVVPAYPTGK